MRLYKFFFDDKKALSRLKSTWGGDGYSPRRETGPDGMVERWLNEKSPEDYAKQVGAVRWELVKEIETPAVSGYVW